MRRFLDRHKLVRFFLCAEAARNNEAQSCAARAGVGARGGAWRGGVRVERSALSRAAAPAVCWLTQRQDEGGRASVHGEYDEGLRQAAERVVALGKEVAVVAHVGRAVPAARHARGFGSDWDGCRVQQYRP